MLPIPRTIVRFLGKLLFKFKFSSNHDQYKKHLNHIFKIKGQVDSNKPESLNFTHLRKNTFKQDMHRMKEMKRENDTLVVKILKLRGLNNNS